MTPTIALALIGSYDKTIDLLLTMLEKASPEDAGRLINLWIEREIWWQANLWRPLGEWIAQQRETSP